MLQKPHGLTKQRLVSSYIYEGALARGAPSHAYALHSLILVIRDMHRTVGPSLDSSSTPYALSATNLS